MREFSTTAYTLQFDSLRREIRATLPQIDQQSEPFDHRSQSDVNKQNIEILAKLYDVNKNTIDKLFDKLGTFSNTWLVVSGGIATSFLIEIFKSESLSLLSALDLIVCSALLWSIAQDLYGILNYELVKKTKDLAYWWATTVGT